MASNELLSIPGYKAIIQTKNFLDMERYSDNFIKSNQTILEEYSTRWILDPLHQWSRQWEYPYVLEKLNELPGKPAAAANILDAGSGVTFFPYYVQTIHPQWSIHCADYDASFKKLHDSINTDSGTDVTFTKTDISALPYDDDYFDAVYCISVLEHTSNYEAIIREFARVLKKAGVLIMTIDISLDGENDISMRDANVLLKTICSYFNCDVTDYLIPDVINKDELFTTYSAYKCNKNFLPPRLIKLKTRDYIRSCLTFKRPMPNIPYLGVYGAAFRIDK